MDPSTVITSSVAQTQKPRILVVDDEPDNLDLLFRTFRRDFEVLRANSGQAALEILAENGEVAVIISDQRMPEMRGTEFLSKTVPEFPDTVRIILTGFTDVEDLVEAINSGQVYRYITKPWEPDELKQVVQQAVCTYEFLKQRGDAIELSQGQQILVTALAEIAQTTSDMGVALTAIAQTVHSVIPCQGCQVYLVTDGQLRGQVGTAGELSVPYLVKDPLVKTVIMEKKLQLGVGSNPTLISEESMGTVTGVADEGTYCLAPILFRDAVIAVLCLQWDRPKTPSGAIQQMIQLAAKQTGLILACL